jgi:hypothetical protein
VAFSERVGEGAWETCSCSLELENNLSISRETEKKNEYLGRDGGLQDRPDKY